MTTWAVWSARGHDCLEASSGENTRSQEKLPHMLHGNTAAHSVNLKFIYTRAHNAMCPTEQKRVTS